MTLNTLDNKLNSNLIKVSFELSEAIYGLMGAIENGFFRLVLAN